MPDTEENFPPLMAEVAVCGFPSPAEEYVESPLDLNKLLVHRPAATYFVRASGDSMLRAGIRNGDILVVDRSLQPWDGAIVIACIDGDFTVKYFRNNGQRVWLEAGNERFQPIYFQDGMELRIFGVVTSLVHQFVN